MRFLLPLALAAVAPVAQVPYDYVLVSEKTKSGRPSMRYIQPILGVVTTMSIPNQSWWISVDAVGLDPAQPGKIYWAKNAGTPTVQFYGGTVSGNEISTANNLQVQIKNIDAIEIRNSQIYFVERSSQTPGMWVVPVGGSVPQMLFPQPGLTDIVELGGRLYTITYMQGSPSTIIEYDPVTTTQRTLGTTFQSSSSLGQFNGQLLVGAENGDIFQVDPQTGTPIAFLTPNKGPVTAIASRAGSPFFYFVAGPNSDELYSLINHTTPLYSVPAPHGPIGDIVLGIHDQASFLTDGQGCVGSGGRPTVDANGLPSIGNPNFGVNVRKAGALKAGTMVVGTSRQTWGANALPFSLAGIGMTGCTLYTDIIESIGVVTSAGGVATVPITIPNFQWKGGRLTGQFIILDAGANPLGVTASDGFEAIVR